MYEAEIDAHLIASISAESKKDAECYLRETLAEISEFYGIDIKYRINFITEEKDDE